jgi:hypothetical protein
VARQELEVRRVGGAAVAQHGPTEGEVEAVLVERELLWSWRRGERSAVGGGSCLAADAGSGWRQRNRTCKFIGLSTVPATGTTSCTSPSAGCTSSTSHAGQSALANVSWGISEHRCARSKDGRQRPWGMSLSRRPPGVRSWSCARRGSRQNWQGEEGVSGVRMGRRSQRHWWCKAHAPG